MNTARLAPCYARVIPVRTRTVFPQCVRTKISTDRMGPGSSYVDYLVPSLNPYTVTFISQCYITHSLIPERDARVARTPLVENPRDRTALGR